MLFTVVTSGLAATGAVIIAAVYTSRAGRRDTLSLNSTSHLIQIDSESLQEWAQKNPLLFEQILLELSSVVDLAGLGPVAATFNINTDSVTCVGLESRPLDTLTYGLDTFQQDAQLWEDEKPDGHNRTDTKAICYPNSDLF